MSETNENNQKENSSDSGWKTFFTILLVVIVIAVVIAFAWALIIKSKSEEEEEDVAEVSRKKLLKEKKEELQIIQARIQFLATEIKKIKQRERLIFIGSRALIIAAIGFIDWRYINYYGINFQIRDLSTELLKLNSAIIALYSCLAFISHGTPTKFAEALKSFIGGILEKSHLETITEYNRLLNHEKLLIAEISELDNDSGTLDIPFDEVE